MDERSVHSASGQALGYVHQCLWALVELGRSAAYEPATQLRLEALDDIEIGEDGHSAELIQVKHHLGDSTLTTSSTDLWRTINVWVDLTKNNNAMLRLVTTQEIAENSGLIGLRSGKSRNSFAAHSALLKAANESKNKTTRLWRNKFIELDDETRESLVDRIYIIDRTVQAAKIDVALLQTFRYACAGKEQVFLDLLKGWWTKISVRLLDRSLDAVTGTDLLNQVNDITDQLRNDTLPIDPNIFQEYDASITENYRDRVFVQQLTWIALDNERLWKAIRDYHRSFTQRSFWLRHQLLAESEVDRYAFKLRDEWEQIFDSRLSEMRRLGRTDEENIGQEVLESFSRESRARIRERFDESWFSRGMFHALADGELGAARQIGWHPSFADKLGELLDYA